MRAPVYRFVDAGNTLLGLAFPGEALVFLGAAWPAMLALPPSLAAAALVAAYLGIRLVGRGRPEAFVQHWLWWQVRQLRGGGRLSATARACTPPFRLAPMQWRDLAPRGRRG